MSTDSQHEQSLSHALDTIESRYYVQGAHQSPLTLTVNGSSAHFPMSLASADQQLQALQQLARPSAFGRNSETVRDPAVRVAKELEARKFSIDFDPAAAGILEKVRLALVPEAASVRAELYKLNLMTQGGFFKAHQDTPRGGDTCFGTLVVALPVPFWGGALTLRHNSTEASLNWSAAVQPPSYYSYGYGSLLGGGVGNNQGNQECIRAFVPDRAGLQWGAFFGDVHHEVMPVTQGFRITLTYTLHRDAAPDPTADVLLLRASGFHNQLVAALADPQFMAQGGAIGFHCRHLYEETALAQSEAKLAAGGAAAYAAKLKLKNEDAVIAAVLAATGLEVKALRLLKMEYLEDDYVLDKIPTKKDAARFGYRERIENAFMAMAVTPDEVESYAKGTVAEAVGHDVTWLGSHRAAKKEWVDRWYGEYFGNEGSQATFYTAAAFVAVIPSFAERGSINAAAARKQLTAQLVHPDLPSSAVGRGGGGAGSRKRKSAGGDDDVICIDTEDEDFGDDCDDMSGSDDQDDSGSEDEEGDYRPPKKKAAKKQQGQRAKAAKTKRGAAAGRGSAAAAAATAAAAAAAVSGAAAPPVLFRPKSPSKMTAAEKRAAALDTTRRIHVTGGQGGKAGNGSCTVELPPGAGLKELKALLRKKFGKVSHSKMGSLMLVDANGRQTGAAAKATDLVDGARVQCTYTYAQGNLANLMGGGFGGFGGRRRVAFGWF